MEPATGDSVGSFVAIGFCCNPPKFDGFPKLRKFVGLPETPMPFWNAKPGNATGIAAKPKHSSNQKCKKKFVENYSWPKIL